MRKLLIAFALLVALVFIFINLAEVQDIARTLQQGDWRYLLLALGIEAVFLLNAAASFRAVYRLLGMEEQIGRLYLMVAAANFVNVIAPSGGMGGLAVFISEAKPSGYSTARVTVAGVLVILFDYVGFLCVLALGLIVLFRRNNLNVSELVATAILVVVASVMGTLLYLGMRSADSLGRALAWMARGVNRLLTPFMRRDYLSVTRAHEFAHEAAEGLNLIRQEPRHLIYPAALSLSSKALHISILFFCFLAFKVPLSVGTLIGGFSIGYLFFIVSPTPAGIGVVEGALTLGLRSLNVPLGAATVIALSYRGITFWAPWMFGMLALRWLSFGKDVHTSA